MSSWLNGWCPFKGDRQEERPGTSPWLRQEEGEPYFWSRDNNLDPGEIPVDLPELSVPEEILMNHPEFFACWKGQETLIFPDASYHVAHVLLRYIHKREYQNLKVHGTYQEGRAIDFSAAIYVYKISIKYQLPELGQLAGERIRIYGDEIAFPEMIKRLSSPPLNNMELQSVLRDYLCSRITREGPIMSTETRAEIEKVIGSTMISILYQRIARLEREKQTLKETVNNLP
ncbi:hypothetical protein FPCIR_14124 [Fusarium pseudocircinatum]|uniref:Uncharacterized protein n=1 Tax=Fusarium pseudocircinatum TaxID=56676 RepID=A0A8H5KFP9_9HYPO|nr:hypothetical protein FPCIR_14124 [Fusarium pseudocircinatum]